MMVCKSTLATAALAVTSLSTAANAYDARQIGEWRISGQDGVCSAGLMQGDTLIILISADGGNEGGITLTDDRWMQAKTEERLDMQISLGKKWIDQEALSLTDMPGFWLSYSMVYDAPKWPDRFSFKLSDGGTTIVSLELKDVKSAVAELNRCDAEVARR